MIPHELLTPRLRLRAWRAGDAEALAPILARDVAHLSPWIPASVATPASVPELAARLDGYAADFGAARAWRYAMWRAADDELLGEIDLFPRDAARRVAFAESDRAEVGYWVRSDRVGSGFVSEGVRAVIAAAREVERFTRLEIRCDPRNARSAAVPARLGFVREPGPSSEVEVWTLSLGDAESSPRDASHHRHPRLESHAS